MRLNRLLAQLFLAAGLLGGVVPHVAGAEETKPTAVRPEIGKPVQAAQELLKAKKGRDALAKLKETDGVGGKSPYETYVVELTRGQAASQAGDPASAAVAFEAAASVAPSNKEQLLAAAASQNYMAKNYGKAAELAARYKDEGGKDPALRTLQVQSLYLAGNLAQAAKEIQNDLRANDLIGTPPPEQLLQMLADIANRQKDSAGFINAMERLVAAYPKRDYWASLVYALATRPGLSDRLALDVLRTKKATDTLRTADEYVEAAQLAVQAGFPYEANKFLHAGYDAKLLGTGPEAARHQRLRDAVSKALAQDEQSLGQDDAKAEVAGGDMLLNTGFNYVLRGKADKGLPMMERALSKGTLRRPDEARLHLGIAQVMGGQKARAHETLKGVTGKDGSADIARLWLLLARGKESAAAE